MTSLPKISENGTEDAMAACLDPQRPLATQP